MSVAKRLSNISLEDSFTINSVLQNIPTKALTELYLADNHGVERNESWKKNDLKKLITPAITSAATKYVVERMTTEQLAAAVAPLKINHTKKRNNPNSRKVLSKRLTENLMNTGLTEFFEQYAETPLLTGIAGSLELQPASSKAALVKQIADAADAEGLRLYLESFSEEVLRDVAFDMKLERDPLALNSRQVLVECILHNHEIPEKEHVKEVIKVSKTKPELKKGVKYQDVFQHYTVEELHDWAKKNGLKTTGNKPDLIKRILAFFDGDKENIMAGERRVPKRKSTTPKEAAAPKEKAAAPKEKAAAPKEKAAAPKEQVAPVKKAAPPKEEPAEEEEEVEEEEEADEEEEFLDLDLDNLDSHNIADLKRYCEEEQISVKGSKKSDYIAAILAYNDEDEEEEEEDEEEH